jgi:uncharacterized secreted protein with C-terminal beta-propeller domain
MNADLNGRTNGLKLAMFDVSNPSNVTEKQSALLNSKYDYSEASYNHKAILVSADRGLIAFPVSSQSGMKYLLYSYTAEGGFQLKGELSLPNDGYWWNTLRGLYIGDYFYVVGQQGAYAYRLDTLAAVDHYAFEVPNSEVTYSGGATTGSVGIAVDGGMAYSNEAVK